MRTVKPHQLISATDIAALADEQDWRPEDLDLVLDAIASRDAEIARLEALLASVQGQAA